MIENIVIKGLRNTRDLGQLSDLTTVKIKKKTLIRSGRIDKMSEKKRNQFFKDYNIKLVIDLRTDVEIEEGKIIDFPSTVKYVKIPILNKSFFGITHEKKMSKALSKDCKRRINQVKDDMYLVEMYKSILFSEESQKMLQEALELILKTNDGAILYHCSSGKDRTGILTMLILYILGVDEQTIIDDYQATEYFNRFYIRSRMFLLKIGFFLKKDFRNLLKHMLKAKKEYMQKTIEALKAKYGSLDNYLINTINFSLDKWQNLKEMCLEN